MPAAGYAGLQEQINQLGASMEKGFARIEALLASYEARTRALEQQEASCQPIITNRLVNVEMRLKDHDDLFTKIREETGLIQKNIQELQLSNRILKWLGGIVGGAVVLYIVAALLKLI